MQSLSLCRPGHYELSARDISVRSETTACPSVCQINIIKRHLEQTAAMICCHARNVVQGGVSVSVLLHVTGLYDVHTC